MPSWLTPEWVEAIAIAAAGIAAWRGFGAWRHELVGKKRYELAEEALSLFYEAQSTIAQMRTGIVDIRDVWTPRPDRSVEPDDPMVKWFREVDAERRALFAKLASFRFRFTATFGRELDGPFNEFASVESSVRVAAVRVHELSLRLDHGKNLEASKRYEAIRYAGLEGEDEIAKRISDAVAQIERVCREEVKPKTMWDRWVEWTKPPEV